MVDQCKYMIAFKLPEVKELPSFYIDGRDDRRPAWLIAIPRQRPFELSKNIGKTSKCRFLSCPQDRSTLHFQLTWFPPRFAHFGSIRPSRCCAFLPVTARLPPRLRRYNRLQRARGVLDSVDWIDLVDWIDGGRC